MPDKFTEIFFESNSHQRILLESGRIENFSSGKLKGMGLRSIQDDFVEYTSADSPDEARVEKECRCLGLKTPDLPAEEPPGENLKNCLPFLSELDKKVRKEPRVIQFRLSLAWSKDSYAVSNSLERRVSWKEYFFTARAEVFLGKKGEKISASEVVTLREEVQRNIAEDEIKAATEKALRRALLLSESPKAPLGNFPVVIHS
ncbi:MAG TPA: DNA gyrase modulator, partial [bacterium]|nr:DNA gyrase modulator [bacterium]